MFRPNPPAACPFAKPRSAAAKRASKLHAEWRERFERVEFIEREHRAAVQAHREADDALTEALYQAERTGKEPANLAEVQQAARDAEATLNGPWHQRIEVAVRAVHDAEAAYQAHVVEHARELLAELREDAEQARAQLVEAADALGQAFDRWHEERHRVEAVVRYLPGVDSRDVPNLDTAGPVWSRLAQDAREVDAKRLHAPALNPAAFLALAGELPTEGPRF
ncbi:MAG TPA: hypothetical protein VNS09_07325 [Solirubrobacter sp.]|nr:hypothetical protein [Solirubrobacter sp.]